MKKQQGNFVFTMTAFIAILLSAGKLLGLFAISWSAILTTVVVGVFLSIFGFVIMLVFFGGILDVFDHVMRKRMERDIKQHVGFKRKTRW